MLVEVATKFASPRALLEVLAMHLSNVMNFVPISQAYNTRNVLCQHKWSFSFTVVTL